MFYVKASTININDCKLLLQKMDYPNTLKACQKFLKEQPTSFEGHLTKGKALSFLNRRKDAILSFSMALKCAKSTFEQISALNNKGVQYLEIKKHKEAHNCFKKVLALDSNNFEAQFNIGNLLAFDQKNSIALEIYLTLEKNIEKTIVKKGDPILFNVYVNIALTYLQLEKYEDAVKYFDLALNLLVVAKDDDEMSLFIFRHLSEIYFKKGNCLNKLQRYEEAKRCYMQAEQLK